jgi:hypothetical protein
MLARMLRGAYMLARMLRGSHMFLFSGFKMKDG